MPIVKYVTFFRFAEGYGWSEIHYRDVGSGTPDLGAQLDNLQQRILPLRAALLGEQCSIIAARASFPRAGDVASLPRSVTLPGKSGQDSENEEVSVALLWTDATRTKRKVTHLRGFWDSATEAGFFNAQGQFAQDYENRLQQWKAALVAEGYGWTTRDPATSAAGVVLSAVSNANDIWTFTLAAPGLPEAVVGRTVPIRFSRFNSSKSVLNRELLVDVTTRTSVTTTAPIAAGPVLGTGRYNFRSLAFVRYNEIATRTIGERRMGKVFNARRGRSLDRPRV